MENKVFVRSEGALHTDKSRSCPDRIVKDIRPVEKGAYHTTERLIQGQSRSKTKSMPRDHFSASGDIGGCSSAGHRAGGNDAEQAPAHPSPCSSALFQRRLRQGIAPLKMDCLRPFKPRTDGRLCILDAPATHIRVGNSVDAKGRNMLTCIDIHTYEYFLMHNKERVDAARELARPPQQDRANFVSSGGGQQSAGMIEAVAMLNNMKGMEKGGHDGYREPGSLISPASSTLSSGGLSPELSPFLESDRCLTPFDLSASAVESDVPAQSSPETVPVSCANANDSGSTCCASRLGCKRGRGCVTVLPQDDFVSSLTPCNVDAGHDLWQPRQPRIAVDFQTEILEGVRAEIQEEIMIKRRKTMLNGLSKNMH